METKAMKWFLAMALAAAWMSASAATASSRRGPMTQIANNVGRVVDSFRRPIARTAGHLAYRHSSHDEAWGRDRTRFGRRQGEPFEWSSVVPAGKSIEIKGVNGDILALPADGREALVKARRSGNRSDPDEVTIEVIEHEDGVTICARYPTPRGEKPNGCAPGEGGHMSTQHNDVRVDFEVRVPDGVGLTARTVNGEIQADDLHGPVDAQTVNGSVQLTTTGYGSAQTVNGSINASLGTADWPEPLSFGTVNGTIRLTVPAGLDVDVRAETMNGTIRTDFPVTVRRKFTRKRLEGTIGRGGQRLDLETLNGDIALRSAS